MPSWKPLLAGLCLLLSAVGQTGAVQTLRVGLADDPDMLDPSMARTFTGRIVFAALCDKLFDISRRGAGWGSARQRLSACRDPFLRRDRPRRAAGVAP